jgi:adenine-specific DNA-methyltransferase
MAKPPITKTELVWPGKYTDDGVLAETQPPNLPLQTLELHGPPTEWRNKLIWGDNFLVMGSLLKEFAGKIDLIYIDPPFATGADFSFAATIGQQQVAYRDSWKIDTGGYLAMMAGRLRLIKDMLSPTGTFFLHCDWHVSHLLRAIGDEVFGAENFLNEIVWYYYNKFQGNVKRFASNHDVVLWYRKGVSYQFHPQVEKRTEGNVKQLVRSWDKKKAAIVNAKGADGKVMYRETDERTVDDVWRLSMLQPADRTENCGFPTQKPEALLQRIVQAASSPGDLVADFFCGSGTMLAVAEKLNRRWIGCDLGRWGIHTTRKRLLSINNYRPFALLNLGKHEREYWHRANFGLPCEYVAFMLKLYDAHPSPGLAHIHGKKNNALVHIGTVDAAVATADINAAIDECAALKKKELHVLGWDWNTERCDLMIEAARQKGIKLLLLRIPQEVMEPQAVAKSDVRFCPLACLEAEIEQPDHLTARVALKGFLISNPEWIPEEVRSKAEKWSDYIDYWDIDWDPQNDTFKPGWAAYRTRKERELPLVSGFHAYENAGRRSILVRAIDIFGNETTQALKVEFSSRNDGLLPVAFPTGKSAKA